MEKLWWWIERDIQRKREREKSTTQQNEENCFFQLITFCINFPIKANEKEEHNSRTQSFRVTYPPATKWIIESRSDMLECFLLISLSSVFVQDKNLLTISNFSSSKFPLLHNQSHRSTSLSVSRAWQLLFNHFFSLSMSRLALAPISILNSFGFQYFLNFLVGNFSTTQFAKK